MPVICCLEDRKVYLFQKEKAMKQIYSKHISLSLIINIICLGLYCASCHNSDFKLVRVEPEKIHSSLCDTIYLSTNCANFTFHNGRYYVSDYNRGIISFDDNFNDITQVNLGSTILNSPQCYMFALHNDDTLSFYNPFTESFYYIKNDSVSKITDTRGYIVAEPTRMITRDNDIQCSILCNRKINMVVHRNGSKTLMHSQIKSLDDPRKPYQSSRTIVKDDTHYYVIGQGVPVIQMYTHDSKPVASLDLRLVDRIKETIENERDEKANSYFTIVKDAYAFNGILYLLTTSKDAGVYQCNNIFKIVYRNRALTIKDVYELPGKLYSTFCVNNDGQVVAINSKTGALEFYDL